MTDATERLTREYCGPKLVSQTESRKQDGELLRRLSDTTANMTPPRGRGTGGVRTGASRFCQGAPSWLPADEKSTGDG